MNILIATLGSGKGSWGHVSRVINEQNWEKVLVVTNDFGQTNFKPEKEVEYLVADPLRTSLTKLTEELVKKLKNKIKEKEIFLNIVSGSGKEHMAIISALQKAGISFKTIALTGSGVIEI